MDCSGPRYRDREESRFYQARGLSPEQTWTALADELAWVLDDAQQAFWRVSLRIDPARIRWWHGAIFARHFPHDGGRFRHDRAFFDIVTPSGGTRQLEGTAPGAIQSALRAVCSSFNQRADALGDPDTTSVLDRTRAVSALYVGILRVHPFIDGNHRVRFVTHGKPLYKQQIAHGPLAWEPVSKPFANRYRNACRRGSLVLPANRHFLAYTQRARASVRRG
jgi:fido (protein-threonine AMPylation protein)